VRVSVEPGSVTSLTGDVGPGGIFVRSARVLRPGTPVRIVVQLPGGLAKAAGVVRWAKRIPVQFLSHVRGGMGIEFTWRSPELEAFLDDAAEPMRQAV
jgi:hypothetical protein